jgi:hypothetical protein
MPRPRILDEQKKQQLVSLLMNGLTLAAAAQVVGCSTLTIWREARRNPQFEETLRQAQFARDLNPVRTLRDAAANDWRAAAWLLERTQPEHYARRAANSFSPQDVAALLDRVCEAIGEETEDDQISARIKRRALAIANDKIVHQQQNPLRPRLAAPIAPPTTDRPGVPDSEHPATSIQHPDTRIEHPASSPVDTRPHLIRASDFSRIELKPAAQAR